VIFLEPHKYNHSATAIKTFLEICQRRYASEKLSPWTGSVDAARGDMIHAALEQAGRRAMTHNGSMIVGDLPQIYCADNEPEARRAKDPCRWPLNTYEMTQWLTNAIDGSQDLRFTAVEDWYKAPVPGCVHPLLAKIDGVCSQGPNGLGECIIDYKSVKTMGKRMSPYEVKQSIQGKVYSWLTGIRSVAFGFFTSNHPIEWVSHTYTEQDIADFERFLIHTCKLIEARWKDQTWSTCQPGGLCSAKWCSLYKECYPKIEKGETIAPTQIK
jgi:hypothetical protein